MTVTATPQEIRGYEILEMLGEGGFGSVYRAYQPVVGREVALKVIRPDFANRPDFVRRFEAEAQIIARLEHFHIVPLYDYWRDPNGAYFVMRYLRGGTARDLLANEGLTMPLLLQMVEQVAAALAVAHRNGVVHRDLKPDNIMLDEDRNAYLVDFGIAKLLDEATKTGEVPSDTGIVGSPAYTAPEQITGEMVTAYADQYSLGVLLYEMLTGAHPYAGANISQMLVKQMHDPLPSVRRYREDLPAEVDYVLARATRKVPHDRYPTISDLAAHLRNVLAPLRGTVTPVPDGEAGAGKATLPLELTTTHRDTLDLGIDPVAVTNPYKGLRAFQEADSADFFGRDALVDELLTRIEGEGGRFLAVVGPSGSGKSSAVKAGVVPAVKRGRLAGSENWFVVEMFPGAFPLEELEAALLRVAVRSVESLLDVLRAGPDGLIRAAAHILPADDSELLLVVDQFEEAFTFGEDEREREQFLALVHAAGTTPASRVRVIATLRADFYDRPLMYPAFGQMFRRNTEVVLPMNDAELTEAITGPARRVRMHIEPTLVQAIIDDLRDQPGALPLLQYALTELFERRDGPNLTLEAYRAIGGAMGALARRAEDLYTQLEPIDQETARQLFLRLVTLGEGTEDTRRRVLRGELISLAGDDDSMARTIDVFTRYRLLTLDRDANTREPTVEIAHESLIREWGQLRDWLNSSREGLRMQRRVMNAAADWARFGRDNSYLATGAQLETFQAWANTTTLELTALEADYIQNSVAQHEQALARQAEQAAREAALERRSRNVLRALVSVLILALALALGLSTVAFRERNAAQQSAARADRAAALSQSASLAAQARLALVNNDIDLAVTLALAANTIPDPPPIAQNVLFDAAYQPGTSHLLAIPAEVNTVTMTPTGAVVYGGRDGSLGVWNPATGTTQDLTPAGGAAVNVVVAHPRRGEVLVGRIDGELAVYNVVTGALVNRYEMTVAEGGRGITALATTRDGTEALAGLANGEVLRVALADGAVVARLPAHSGAVTRIQLNRDASRLLTASVDRTVRLWTPDGTPTGVFEAHTAPVRDARFIGTGDEVVSAAQNGEMFVWQAGAPEVLRRVGDDETAIWRLALGPGDTVFVGGQDGSLRQWDLITGDLLALYSGHTGTINEMAATTAPGNIVTASADGTVRVWNFYNRQLGYLVEDTGSSRGGLFTLDIAGDTMVVGGAFGSLNLYNTASGRKDEAASERLVAFTTSFTQVAFVRDGTQIVTGSQDGSISLWDIATGTEVGAFGRHLGVVHALAVRDGLDQFATASRDRTLRVWSLSGGGEVTRPVDGEFVVTALAYSPSGDALLVGTGDGAVMLYDAETYALLYTAAERFERDVVTLAFNADGSQFAAGSLDRTARVYERATGTLIQHLVGHEDPVQGVAFAPSGGALLTGSGNTFADDVDVSLRLWDIATGQQLRQFGDEHTQEINALAFTPDGRGVISVNGNSDILRYDMLTPAELIAYTQANRYARPLTCGEQALYRVVQAGDPCP